jgi:hypothetical protein
LRGHLARACGFQQAIDAGEVANAAAIASREGLPRARVCQILGLLRLHPDILADIEDDDGAGPVPAEGALRKLALVPREQQIEKYEALVEAEVAAAHATGSTRPSRAHLPRRGFAHLFERARRFQAMLDAGEVRSLDELGRREGLSGDHVSQILCLLHLAPDIVEVVDRPADGPSGVTYRELRRIARLGDPTAQRRAFYGQLAPMD